MENSDYTEYSIERLQDWVSDALQTQATGDEIADAIVTVLQQEVEYHMEAMNKASTVLARLRGSRRTGSTLPHTNKDVALYGSSDWADFWNSQPGPNERVITFS